jgi:hypothetical protein
MIQVIGISCIGIVCVLAIALAVGVVVLHIVRSDKADSPQYRR